MIIPKGDYGVNRITGTLQNADGTVFNPTTYTVTFKCWRQTIPEAVLFNRAGSVVSGVAGTVAVSVLSTDFIAAENLLGCWQCTKAGEQITFGPIIVTVTENP